MHKFLPYFLVPSLLMLVGCSPVSPESGTSSSEVAETYGQIEIQQLQARIDIGDLESYTHFWIHLSQESLSPFIENVEVFSKKEKLSKATLKVSKPYPKELWLQLDMKTIKLFAGYAMVLRVRVFLDGEVIENIDFVCDDLTERIEQNRQIELLSKFDSLPETALVHAEATIIMFGQEELNVDELDSVQLTPKNSVVILSNPLRINFGT